LIEIFSDQKRLPEPFDFLKAQPKEAMFLAICLSFDHRGGRKAVGVRPAASQPTPRSSATTAGGKRDSCVYSALLYLSQDFEYQIVVRERILLLFIKIGDDNNM
jgi:hypothetical protein